MTQPRVLLIDNYDSFTYNLYQYLCELGADVTVVRNDAVTVARQVGPFAFQGLGQRQDVGRNVARAMGGANQQKHIVRLEIADGRRLVVDVDRMAGAFEHRLQRVGHHLGIARFGADQDQDLGHRIPR